MKRLYGKVGQFLCNATAPHTWYLRHYEAGSLPGSHGFRFVKESMAPAAGKVDYEGKEWQKEVPKSSMRKVRKK